jgi:hypothetical protein
MNILKAGDTDMWNEQLWGRVAWILTHEHANPNINICKLHKIINPATLLVITPISNACVS